MSGRRLSFARLQRRRKVDGEYETLDLRPGVNLVYGPPNSGKSVWLRMLDYMLGDDNGIAYRFNTDIRYKYDQIQAELCLARNEIKLRRTWSPYPDKDNRFTIDGRSSLGAKRLQRMIMTDLGIPEIPILRGNEYKPYPVTLRVLMRHLHRQQRFWGDIADEQYPDEIRASILVLIGAIDLLFLSEQKEIIAMRRACAAAETERHGLSQAIERLWDATFPREAAGAILTVAIVRSHLDALEAESLALGERGKLMKQTTDPEGIDRLLALAFRLGKVIGRVSVLQVLRDLCERREQLANWETEASARLLQMKTLQLQSGENSDALGQIRKLEQSMNEYLNQVNEIFALNGRDRPWKHHKLSIEDRNEQIFFRVGPMVWSKAIGGTDSLYFLMAYHYGLLKLSADKEANCPGFALIDLPADFSGETIRGKEGLVVRPFVDLCSQEAYSECQVVIAGRSFDPVCDCHSIELKEVFVA